MAVIEISTNESTLGGLFVQAIELAERRAKENAEFAALLSEILASLEHRGDFDLSRLYETSYGDFQVLLGVLQSWRLQRFREDVLTEFRTSGEASARPC
jgi:hypothetical protein